MKLIGLAMMAGGALFAGTMTRSILDLEINGYELIGVLVSAATIGLGYLAFTNPSRRRSQARALRPERQLGAHHREMKNRQVRPRLLRVK